MVDQDKNDSHNGIQTTIEMFPKEWCCIRVSHYRTLLHQPYQPRKKKRKDVNLPAEMSIMPAAGPHSPWHIVVYREVLMMLTTCWNQWLLPSLLHGHLLYWWKVTVSQKKIVFVSYMRKSIHPLTPYGAVQNMRRAVRASGAESRTQQYRREAQKSNNDGFLRS